MNKQPLLKISNVYISCPMTVPTAVIGEVVRLAKKAGAVKVTSWVRGTPYKDDNLREADTIILIPPNNEFKMSLLTLSAGARKEIRLADKLEKNLFIAYERNEGGLGLYCMGLDENYYYGESGTRSVFRKHCTSNQAAPEHYPLPLDQCNDTVETNFGFMSRKALQKYGFVLIYENGATPGKLKYANDWDKGIIFEPLLAHEFWLLNDSIRKELLTVTEGVIGISKNTISSRNMHFHVQDYVQKCKVNITGMLNQIYDQRLLQELADFDKPNKGVWIHGADYAQLNSVNDIITGIDSWRKDHSYDKRVLLLRH